MTQSRLAVLDGVLMFSSAPREVPDLAIIIPVRNEAQSLPQLLTRLSRVRFPGAGDIEMIVVDDGSTDGSAELARKHDVRVVKHEGAPGYGAAIKIGLAATAAQHIAIIDADCTYAPEDLATLYAALPEAGMVVGARTQEPSLVRLAIKAGFRLAVRLVTGEHVPDLNSGLRIFNRRVADRLADVLPDRFSLTTTLTLGSLALGVPVAFLPIAYGRRSGRSKFSVLDVARFAWTVTRGCRWILQGRVDSGTSPQWARWLVFLGAACAAIALLPESNWRALSLSCVAGALAYIPFVMPKVVRWRRLLRACAVELSFSDAWRAYFTGLALGAVTPGRVGELARIATPIRQGHPLGAVALATVIDRIMDLAILAAVTLATLASISATPMTATLAVTAAGIVGFALLAFSPASRVVTARLVGVLQSTIPPVPPKALLEAGFWTLLSMSLFFAIALVLAAAAGVVAPIQILIGAIAAANLAAIVPISVGGVGTREAAMLGALAAAGFSASAGTVAAYGVAFHTVFTLTPWVVLAGTALTAALAVRRAEVQ